MLKEFKDYDDFMLNFNLAKDNFATYNKYLTTLILKTSNMLYTTKGKGYYEFLREKVEEASNEISEYNELAKEIFTNQKTNKEILRIILDTINGEAYMANKYKPELITVSTTSIFEKKEGKNYNFELSGIKSTNATTYLLLIKQDLNHLITEVFNDEKYNKYLKEGYIIELDAINYRLIDSNEKLNNYLDRKTIDIDKIKGLKPTTVEIIKEKLFDDYQKNKSKSKTLKKEK